MPNDDYFENAKGIVAHFGTILVWPTKGLTNHRTQ